MKATYRALTALCIIFFLGNVFPGTVLWAEDLEFTAGKVRSVFAEGKEQTVLEGGAMVSNSDFHISADSITLSGENNRYIESSGSVELQDLKNGTRLRAEHLKYDSREENLILEGNAGFTDVENDIQVQATFIERQEKLVVFQLNVQIIREDLIARAEYVRYFEDSKKMELSGFPVVYYKGDEYSAERISIYTETDEIVLEGEVQGQISDRNNGDGSSADNGSAAGGDGSSVSTDTPVEAVPGTRPGASDVSPAPAEDRIDGGGAQ